MAASGFDADLLDVLRRRDADLPPEYAGEVAGTHPDARRQLLDGHAFVQVLGDPHLEIPQRLPVGELVRALRAELRLSAGALHEDDEAARDAQRHFRPVISLEQGQ